MKFLKNKKHKALMAAVTMSLVMGVCGSAMADNYAYGQKDNSFKIQDPEVGSIISVKSGFNGVWDGSLGSVERIFGGYSSEEDAVVHSNIVKVAAGEIHHVYGGDGSTLAKGNTVYIEGGENIWKAVGGHSISGSVENNIVEISGGNFYCEYDEIYVLGGDASGESGYAMNNIVNISGGVFTSNGTVIGGSIVSDYKNAKNNIVNIVGTGGELQNVVIGYNTDGSPQIGNLKGVSDINMTMKVYGGKVNSLIGSAEGNVVNIGAGVSISSLNGGVNGGYAQFGNANHNTLNITGGTINGLGMIKGGISEYGNINYNIVNISGGTQNSSIYGGFSGSGDGNANNNIVNISGGTQNELVIGGEGNNANNNIVNISGGTQNSDINGGFGVITNNNVVNIVGLGSELKDVVVGYNADGSPKIGNLKGVSNVSIAGNVYGANSNGSIAVANGNVVNIAGAAIGTGFAEIYGGRVENFEASGKNEASGNEVNIISLSEGNSVLIIYGGCCLNGAQSVTVSDNIVRVQNAVADKVCGGQNNIGKSIGNKVYLKSGFKGSSVNGGYGSLGSEDNKVFIDGVDSSDTEVKGGSSGSGTAKNNSVSVENSNLNKIYGGKSISEDAVENTVEIVGNTTNARINMVFGGYSEQGNVEENTVKIKGVEIVEDVYGGKVNNTTGTAKNNNVILSGGTIYKNVFGGIGKEGATVENNNVFLLGMGASYGDIANNTTAPTVNGTVYGGVYRTISIGEGEAFKGVSNTNTIHVYGKGSEVGNINAANLNFYIQSGLTYGDTMLHITGTDDVKLDNTDVKVEIQAVPQGGDKGVINLIDAPNTTITEPKSKTVEVEKGKTLTFKGKIERQDDDKKLVLVVDELVNPNPPQPDPVPPQPVNENGKSLIETRAAAAAVVNIGADFMANQGMSQAKAAAMTGNGMEPFAAVGGSKMKIESGSYVDMNGWNGALGMAKKVKDVTFGVAVEHGKGNYDSYLDNGFHAKGDIKSVGGTLFAELQKENGNHFDVALRAGRVKTDYNNDVGLSYDDSNSYFGASVGGGHEFMAGKKSSLDVYGRYFWSRTAASEVTPDTNMGPGNRTTFDAVNTNRLFLGTRYTQKINEKNQIYAGLAWQYEFNGDARATIYNGSRGYSAPAPSLKGHSGMVELGCKVEASKNLAIDLNVNGWTGKQKGVTGSVNMQWKF